MSGWCGPGGPAGDSATRRPEPCPQCRPTMRTVGLCILFLVACGTSSAQRPATEPSAVGREEDAVRLAVFRHLVNQYAHYKTTAQTRIRFVCLTVYRDGHWLDPSPFIMAAMSLEQLRVVPDSACESGVDGVFLRDDHALGPGLVLRTEEVKIDGNQSTVSGGYYENDLSESGHLYTVERQGDGSWQVTTTQLEWIN